METLSYESGSRRKLFHSSFTVSITQRKHLIFDFKILIIKLPHTWCLVVKGHHLNTTIPNWNWIIVRGIYSLAFGVCSTDLVAIVHLQDFWFSGQEETFHFCFREGWHLVVISRCNCDGQSDWKGPTIEIFHKWRYARTRSSATKVKNFILSFHKLQKDVQLFATSSIS